MDMIKLNRKEIRVLYTTRMLADFPRSEIKPLPKILRALRRGNYDALALMDSRCVIGYAFLIRHEGHILMDYFAVSKPLRGHGIGSSFLRLLLDQYQSAETFLLEAEDPDFAEDDMQRALRARRIAFYRRNGLADPGITAETFGVPYRILAREKDQARSPGDLKKLYLRHWQKQLPKIVFQKFVR